MKTKNTYYRDIEIITRKCKDGYYESFMFKNGELKSFDSCKRKLQKDAIQFAEIMIDGKFDCEYL